MTETVHPWPESWPEQPGPCGRLAIDCVKRVDVTTICDSTMKFLHGECNVSEFKFVMGNTEYTITGEVTEVSLTPRYGGSKIAELTINGDVTTRQVHNEPHFNQDDRHKGLLCVCNCRQCYKSFPADAIIKCVCADCGCGN